MSELRTIARWLGVGLVLAGACAAAAEPDLDTWCLDCHRGEVAPKIEGQHAEYLALQLSRFRDHHRESFPMSEVAGAFDDDGALVWARALSERSWQETKRTVGTPNDRAAGAALVEARGCRTCHGAALRGAESVPRIAGQHAHYLERQLRDFGSDDRYHVPLAGGTRMQALDADQIRQIAAFVASLSSARPD